MYNNEWINITPRGIFKVIQIKNTSARLVTEFGNPHYIMRWFTYRYRHYVLSYYQERSRFLRSCQSIQGHAVRAHEPPVIANFNEFYSPLIEPRVRDLRAVLGTAKLRLLYPSNPQRKSTRVSLCLSELISSFFCTTDLEQPLTHHADAKTSEPTLPQISWHLKYRHEISYIR